MDQLRLHNDPEVRNQFLYPGSSIEYDLISSIYMRDLVDNIKPEYLRYLGLHPWQHGYPGYGSNYNTPFLAEVVRESVTLAESRTDNDVKIIISAINAKGIDHTNQISEYFESFDHAIWWWSALINLLSTADIEVVAYSPFLEDGSIDGKRAMVYEDGQLKPVGYATRFLMTNIQNNLLATTTSNSLEVEALTTASEDLSTINVAIVNKEDVYSI